MNIFSNQVEIANKSFLAGLGLAGQTKSLLAATFEQCVHDGEKVRAEATKSAQQIRDTVQSRIQASYDAAIKSLPVATTADVEDLENKLDEVLKAVS